MSTRSFALPSNRRSDCGDASLWSRTCRAKASPLATALISALLVVQFGCAASKKVQLPEVVGDNPKSSELIQAVNMNAAKIKTIYAPSASVGFNNLPNYAACQLVFENPNKFRLRGSVSLVGQVVDCGCDGTNFWFWGRYQNPDELYYCKLSEYSGSALAEYMPVDPSWFPEALGVDEIKETDILDEPQAQEDGSLLVTLKKDRPDGTYRKRVYFEPRTAAISRQDVQNPNGDVIVSVVCREQQYVESPGVVLPKRLEISCAQSGETLIVDLGSVTLNEENTISSTAFQRPTDLKAREVDVGAALKKKSVAAAPRPAEVTRPAEVARPAETTQAIQTTSAGETQVVAPTTRQTDDSGATWTTANPSQFSQPSTAPNVVATSAANPNVATNGASTSSVSQTNVVSSFAPGSAAQTAQQATASSRKPFVLEGTGVPIDASKGAYPTLQANANPTGGVMLAAPSTSSDSGVTPFPTNLNAQTTLTNEPDSFATSVPIEAEPIRATKPYVTPPTQDAQTAYVADASVQTNVPVGTPVVNAQSEPSNIDEPSPLDDVLLDDAYPSF